MVLLGVVNVPEQRQLQHAGQRLDFLAETHRGLVRHKVLSKVRKGKRRSALGVRRREARNNHHHLEDGAGQVGRVLATERDEGLEALGGGGWSTGA